MPTWSSTRRDRWSAPPARCRAATRAVSSAAPEHRRLDRAHLRAIQALVRFNLRPLEQPVPRDLG